MIDKAAEILISADKCSVMYKEKIDLNTKTCNYINHSFKIIFMSNIFSFAYLSD